MADSHNPLPGAHLGVNHRPTALILSNNNIRSIQEIICASETAAEKYKRICRDFPNLAILTKSATPGEVQ